jgi:hypothetical protein
MKVAIQRKDLVAAMFFGSAYVFMARVPSELLVWQFQGTGLTGAKVAPFSVSVQVGSEELRIHL